MKIENQCCSLEQAKRLKELGVKQESLFYHYVTYSQKDGQSRGIFYTKADAEKKQHEYQYNWNCPTEIFSAYTVAELGLMLPQGYHTYNSGLGEDPWGAMDDKDEDVTYEDLTGIFARTEAECRAALIIHLLEQKLITPKEVNSKIK